MSALAALLLFPAHFWSYLFRSFYFMPAHLLFPLPPLLPSLPTRKESEEYRSKDCSPSQSALVVFRREAMQEMFSRSSLL